jgi:hypothetical protein
MKLMLYLNNSLVTIYRHVQKTRNEFVSRNKFTYLTILNLISNQRWIKRKAKQTLDKWHKDPNNWTLGLFYYNKEDKRIFPQRMAWAGWTVNFANPISVAVLAIVLIIIIGISFFAPKNNYPILLLRYIIQR